MRRTTHREHAAVVEWMEAQWNLPDRTDHYLAGVIREIRQIFAGNKIIPLEDCKIKFKERVMTTSADGSTAATRGDVDPKPWLSLRPDDDPERRAHEASRGRPRGMNRPVTASTPTPAPAARTDDDTEKERVRRLSEEAKAGWFVAAGIPVEMAKSPPRT